MPARTASRRCSISTRRAPAITARPSPASPANTLFFNITGARRDVRRPLLHDHPGDGDRRLARGQEDRCRLRPARSRPRAAVRRPAGRRDPDRRRPHILPRARARARSSSISRCWPAQCSERILFGVTTMETSKLRKRMPVATLLDPKIVVPAIGQAFVKLNPAHADQESGDLRARDRHGVDHRLAGARPGASITRHRASHSRSCSGCGSPCCSRTSPKPWRKAAARRRPTRCAAAAPKRAPSSFPTPDKRDEL